MKKLDEKGDILNAVRKLEIANNYECITEAFGQYILHNSDKLLNEERNLSRNSLSSENKKSQKLITNPETYGFVHNGKIYLNPELMNSKAAVHEYTHLWDAYSCITIRKLKVIQLILNQKMLILIQMKSLKRLRLQVLKLLLIRMNTPKL